MITRLAIALLCALAGFVAFIWLLCCAIVGNDRYWRIAIGFDQAVNAAFGGNEDITISTRAAEARDRGERWGCVLCWLLDRVDPKHCDESLAKRV